jgi:DNA modification methylase/ParB-like chromosome segregation protein Spo0J
VNIELCKVKEYLPISKIKLHPENPRTITRDRLDSLKKSILKKGFYQPILVWKRGNVVLSGNHRLIAVKELLEEGYDFLSPEGKKSVLPVVVEDCSPEVAEAILFEANNSYASWIEDKLMSALEKVDEVALEDYGFSPEQLDAMIKKASADVEKEIEKVKKEVGDVIPERVEIGDKPNEDDVPKEPKKTVVREGDVWQLGEHRLLCGDSTMIDSFKKTLGKVKAQCVFTAPPYNVKTSPKKKKAKDEYLQFCQDVLTNCFAYTDGFIFWNVDYSAEDRSSYIKVIVPYLDHLHETISWERGKVEPAQKGLTHAFETIFVFKNTSFREYLGESNTANFNIWKITNIGQSNNRAFPALLPETGISLSTEVGDVVVDPFLGTGTTLIAAEKTGRVCYGIEIEPVLCDLAIERWQKFTGKSAIHVETGKSYEEYKV